MKIASINTVFFGSTGKIMIGINKVAEESGHKTLPISGYVLNKSRRPENSVVIGGFISKSFHKILSKITGLQGVFSYFATKKVLNKIDKFSPDIIHLHNLHAWFINLPLLFKYIKRKGVKVVWTLHDCWALTGHCTHFTLAKCYKWKTGCYKCPQYKKYPKVFVDSTNLMYTLKKKWFTGIKDLTLVVPSNWLAGLVKESFLAQYPIKVLTSGVDLKIFTPTESDFRKKYNILPSQKIILGVSFGWGYSKGIDVFCELSKRLDENKYKIVLVGTDEETDKYLPENIISIHRTNNQTELVKIYTAADLFVNPTREEVLGMVNVEALSCGTPVLTFRTGGSPETIDESCGFVVEANDVDAMEKEIVRICENNIFSKEACFEKAKTYDMYDRFKEYVKIYDELTNK